MNFLKIADFEKLLPMLRLNRLVPSVRACRPRLVVPREFLSFSSHLFTKNEKSSSLLHFNNNAAYRGLATWKPSYLDRNDRNDKIKNLRSIEEILTMFEKEGSMYDYVNLVNSMHKISVMCKYKYQIEEKDERRVKLLERAAFSKIKEMRARGLSNFIYSFVYLKIEIETETWEAINQNLLKKSKDFNTFDLANTVWALGKLGNRNEEVFKALSNQIKKINLIDFKEQGLSNALYGYALADLADQSIYKEVFTIFSKEILTRDLKRFIFVYILMINNLRFLFYSFNQQAISNIVWSFATLEIKDEKLFESVAKHVVTRNLKEFNEQNISNTLYAFALVKLDSKINKGLFDAFSKHILTRDLKRFFYVHILLINNLPYLYY